MMTDVRVPDEQEGTRAVVRGWLKAVGDTVALNDPLVELETDKVTQEVPAPCAGVLSEIVLESDAEAVPGAVLGRISSVENAAPIPFVSSEVETAPVRGGPSTSLGMSGEGAGVSICSTV